MKTKIIMMSALLALLATGCGKEHTTNDGSMKIFAENMVAGGNSKILIDPNDEHMPMEWLAGEIVRVNGQGYTIASDGNGGYKIGGTEDPLDADGGYYYALFPGGNFNGNSVTFSGTNAEPVMTLNNLVINMHTDGTHDVAFPMGTRVASTETSMVFKHLTAGFRLSLQANTPVTVDKLKVYVYGSTTTVNTLGLEGVSYTVRWSNEGMVPNLPVGPVGEIEDQDITYGSEMVFDMKTEGWAGVEFNTTAKSFCIPVTLTTVKRITVVGYNEGNQVFAKTSAMATPALLGRAVMYPVKTIVIN